MTLKDLLVLVDGSKRSDPRLELTADLARRHRASLTGLHVPDVFQPGADPRQVLSSLELPRVGEMRARNQAGARRFLERVNQKRTRGRMAGRNDAIPILEKAKSVTGGKPGRGIGDGGEANLPALTVDGVPSANPARS